MEELFDLKKFCFKKAVLFLFFFLIVGAGPALAALGASVTVSPGQPTDIYPGETTQLEITLSNYNELAAITAVAFSNNLPGTLPNGLKINGAPTYTCTDPSDGSVVAGSGVLTAVNGTQAISLAGGVIPARANNTDGTCSIKIPVTGGSSTGNAATYTYTIANGAVTGNDGSPVANLGAVSQSVNIRAVSIPTISKTFGTNTL